MLSEEEKDVKKEKDEKREKAAGQGTRAARKNNTPGQMIYIGPAIRGVAQTGTVFRNGLPDSLKKTMKEAPVFNSLLIPVKELGKARIELRDGSSALAACYNKAAAILKNKEGAGC